MLTRSLGTVAPLRPRADAGMKVGTEQAAPTAMEERRRNWRRHGLDKVEGKAL